MFCSPARNVATRDCMKAAAAQRRTETSLWSWHYRSVGRWEPTELLERQLLALDMPHRVLNGALNVPVFGLYITFAETRSEARPHIEHVLYGQCPQQRHRDGNERMTWIP